MSLKIKQKGTAQQLDEQTQGFLNSLSPKSEPLSEVQPEELRSGPSSTEAYQLPYVEVEIEDLEIEVRDGTKINIRVYRKQAGESAPALMFYHGGCWVFCNLDSHDTLCRNLCFESGYTVISVDYRLAPEHKFPTGLHDAYDACVWVHQHRDHLKLTQDELVVSGDSAGGNLATCVCQMSLEEDDFNLRAQVLFYPITDISRFDRQSTIDYEEGYLLSKEMMEYSGSHYIRDESDRLDPLVSPVHGFFTQAFPKTLIQTAEWDVLRDEGEEYAEKLSVCGTDVECVRYNGMIHAYVAIAGGVDFGKVAFLDACDFLKGLN